MPDLAAVAPLAGTADIVEIIEGVARPGSGDGGHQRTVGLLVGQVRRMAEMLEVGQSAGRDEIPGVTQVPFIDEIFGLPVR